MALTRRQAQLLMNKFNHLNIINKPVHMEVMNYALIQFEGNINPGDPTGLKLYL